MSLETQLAAFKTSAQVPDPVAISELLAAEARSRPLKVGDRAPTFTLRAYEGILVPTIAEARVMIRHGDETDSPGDRDRLDHRGA